MKRPALAWTVFSAALAVALGVMLFFTVKMLDFERACSSAFTIERASWTCGPTSPCSPACPCGPAVTPHAAIHSALSELLLATGRSAAHASDPRSARE